MVTRVTVTLPDDVLSELDGVAQTEGVTRSEVVREAAVTYLTGRGASLEARLRQDSVTDGIAWLTDVADRHADDGESSLTVLRDLRGDRGGVRSRSAHEVEE
ncbi:MAG: ribbon-helix-helix protein, CopG family [Coriobacteriia bacterium]|nr:ribbon-helix-helix protein, CopG family [Coriobacteriia bacterium]MBN2847376.1 ribbon-helix-helix protein, CopG family [Coriobacteriia bacterium]